MAVSPRVLTLLEEILDSDRSPEEVCKNDPELLPEVRRQWKTFCRIDEQFEALLPSSNGAHAKQASHHLAKIPEIPGYRVDQILGRGGMGVVYKAWHLRLNRPVAIKMLLSGSYALPQELERFLREAELVAALHHPNIIQIYDAGEVEGRPYFAMELIEGGDLADQIRGVPYTARQAAALMATLAEAVEAAHQSGILHRDLKPGNILITASGTPKVTDFGLARWLDGRDGLTFSATPVGTPSYMAPERAQDDKLAIGPASDIYALGAILYELLTGRPPFRAETAAATLQQALSNDPVPPARLNPQVTRDLETICLKCLHKEPHRRYSSSAALAEDLRRFERGEPIKARRTGQVECVVRWVRRRRALAGAMASGMLLAAALVVFVLWWYGQRMALEASAIAYAEADLNESERLRENGEFKTSAAVLQRAKERLNKFVPQKLKLRLTTAYENLELVKRLDSIRMERAHATPPAESISVLVLPITNTVNATTSSRHYEEALRGAEIGERGDDPAEVATRVRKSSVRRALVAALDDWTACAANLDQQAWILAVLQYADPDPWRDRVRNPMNWENPKALNNLAADAHLAEQSPHLLTVLGARLRAQKIDAVPFLSRVTAAYSKDYWANIELGNAYSDQSKEVEAVESYRTALELRPEATFIHYALGCKYLGLQRWDRCIAEFEQAISLDPHNAWCHNRLGVAWAWKRGHDDEAIAEYRESIRLDPNIGWTHHHLAAILERQSHFEEAAAEYQKAARLFPEKRAHWNGEMRRMLMKLGRAVEAHGGWKEELTVHPNDPDYWFGYAELCLFLGDESEYRSVRSSLLAKFGATKDPIVADRIGRACLLLSPSEDELQQAVALTERAVAVGRKGHEFMYPYYRFAEGLARYRQGRFDDAITLMTGDASKSLGPCPKLVLAMALHQKDRKEEARSALEEAIGQSDWKRISADHPDVWIAHILRREAEALILPKVNPISGLL